MPNCLGAPAPGPATGGAGARPRHQLEADKMMVHPVPAAVPVARAGAGGPSPWCSVPPRARTGHRPARRCSEQDGTQRPRRFSTPKACARSSSAIPVHGGTTGGLTGHADTAHAASIQLIMDAAWAAYLNFHPDLPAARDRRRARTGWSTSTAWSAAGRRSGHATCSPVPSFYDRARLDRAFKATHAGPSHRRRGSPRASTPRRHCSPRTSKQFTAWLRPWSPKPGSVWRRCQTWPLLDRPGMDAGQAGPCCLHQHRDRRLRE